MVRTKKMTEQPVKLATIGFFRELPHGSINGPSLRELACDAPGSREHDVVKYLQSGAMFVMSPGPVWDVIDGSGPIGTASVRTDGVWAWPADLPHYVKVYHVVLPNEFLDHAERNNWQAPEVPIEVLRRLSLR